MNSRRQISKLIISLLIPFSIFLFSGCSSNPDTTGYLFVYFTGLEEAPKQLFVSPTDNACIDADIIKKDGKFYLFFKSEDGEPGIKLALSDKVNEGYKQVGPERVDESKDPVEGSGIFKLNHSNVYILMYDLYIKGAYQFTRSTDLRHFTVIDQEISMNFHPRHGTVMPITEKEMKRLINHGAVGRIPSRVVYRQAQF